ncbi:MAG: sigma-70 family RNA polymerase sigma factor [Clostridiales bacterium]|nr:sigma-70 family RNA polymerase sigma factor [Clostridiales bacterium]
MFVFENTSDKDKFEYIFNKYNKFLIYKAYRVLNDTSLAEDAASEAFIRIYKNIKKIGDADSNSTLCFITVIVKNVALTMLKKDKNNMEDITGYDTPSDYNLENQVISKEGTHKIIDSLTEPDKTIFLLKFAYGMQHKEIAKTISSTENNVTVRLHRIKNKLKEIIEKGGLANG